MGSVPTSREARKSWSDRAGVAYPNQRRVLTQKAHCGTIGQDSFSVGIFALAYEPRAALRASVRRHRSALPGRLWPSGGWIGSHAAAPCWLLNDCHLRPSTRMPGVFETEVLGTCHQLTPGW